MPRGQPEAPLRLEVRASGPTTDHAEERAARKNTEFLESYRVLEFRDFLRIQEFLEFLDVLEY